MKFIILDIRITKGDDILDLREIDKEKNFYCDCFHKILLILGIYVNVCEHGGISLHTRQLNLKVQLGYPKSIHYNISVHTDENIN